MPPRKAAPDGFLLRASDGKFQCKICKGDWMLRSSTSGHLKSSTHADSVKAIETAKKTRTATQQFYADDAQIDLESFDVPEPVQRPAITSANNPSAVAGNPLLAVDGLAPNVNITPEELAHAQSVLDAAQQQTVDAFERRYGAIMETLTEDIRTLRLGAAVMDDDEDDATIATIAHELRQQGILRSRTAQDVHSELGGTSRVTRDSEWFPFESETMFWLMLLLGLPRLRLSSSQIKMFLLVLRKTGARNVPAYNAVRGCQEHLRALCAPRTVQHESVRGNIFFSNDIRTTIALEFANPQVVRHFRFYPEVDPVNGVSEVWDAMRWREVPPDLMTPMAALGNQHFYVDELAQLIDETFVIPTVWLYQRGEVAASCITCTATDDGLRINFKPTDKRALVSLSQFNRTLPELKSQGLIPRFHVDSHGIASSATLPNYSRALAGGDELYTVFVNLWADDVSGNVSKQYNKHINIYVANMNLPAALLQQEFFVRFFSTSPHASAAEQFSALKEQVMSTMGEPYQCYNAVKRTTCKFRIVVQGLPADNPQQSDNCAHMGGQATHNCRRCHNVRSVPSDDLSHVWYESNFHPGTPRNARETERYIQDQLRIACNGVATAVQTAQTKTGIKDSIAQEWIEKLIAKAREFKNSGTASDEAIARKLRSWLEDQPGDKFHPLLDWAGLDPHTDTPVELLHTILLGIAKYVWYDLHSSWTPAMENLFAIRLQSTDMLGLNLPPLRASYFVQYKNNLIGKHFKSLLQTGVFHLHGIATDKQFTLYKATASLSTHLWFGVIKDMEEYLADLQILIDNVLDAFADIDPTRILLKVKLHILTHIIDDIRRFGPAVRFSTEIFECFNAIFRMCSVLSNHQAPSRDIALQLANVDCMKHVLSGGFWKEGEEWVQASENVQSVLLENEEIQAHLGWVPPRAYEPGAATPVPEKHARPALLPDEWQDIIRVRDPQLWSLLFPILQSSNWIQGTSVVSAKGDVCPPQAWVIYSHSAGVYIGRIQDIMLPAEPVELPFAALVKVQSYRAGKDRHPAFDMPILKRPKSASEHTDIIPSKAVQFIINVQHDCRGADCQPTGRRVVVQERSETEVTVPIIEHEDDEHFIINMHAFHNASLLRTALGRDLSRPVHLKNDRSEWLKEKAREAREILVDKRARANEKAAETRAKKKAAQAQRDTDPTPSASRKRPREASMELSDADEPEDVQDSDGIPEWEDDEDIPDPEPPRKRARKGKEIGSTTAGTRKSTRIAHKKK